MAGNITEFDAGLLRLQPSQSGIEANVRAAYRGGALFNRAAMETERAYDTAGRAIGGGVAAAGAAAVQFEDHREISEGAKNGAQLLLDQEQQWNNIVKNTDPNDASVATKFRDQSLEPALENFQSQFHTERSQEWATRFADRVREHMFEKTAADQSTLAGIAIHENALKAANTFAQTVYNDPSSLGIAIDGLNHSIDGLTSSSPTLSAAKAAEIKETFGYDATKQLVSAAIHGAIAKGGDWRSIAENPAYASYVNGPEIEQFVRAQRTQDRINLAYQKQIDVMQRQLDTMNVHKAANEIMKNYVTVDPQTGHAVIDPQYFKDTLNIPRKYPNAPNAAETARTMINWGEAQQKSAAPTHDDPAAVDGLLKVISNPDLSASDAKIAILKADTASPMTSRTRENMLQLAQDMRSLNDPILSRDLEAAKMLVEPKFGGVTANPGAYAKFYYDFIHNQYLPAKAAGTLPPNALDMNDPKSMISMAITKATGGPKIAVPAAISANGGIGAPPAKPGAPAPAVAPAKGEIRMYQGVQYEFQGGDPHDKNNWKPAS